MSPELPRATRTRQSLLDATGKILATEGYAALHEEYLCQRSGVTRGALRHHFPAGRYDLLPAFAARVVAGQGERLAALGDLPARERVYLVLMSMQRHLPSADTVALLELAMAARGDARLAGLLQPILEEAQSQMLGSRGPEINDPELLALRCMVHGACMQVFASEFSPASLQAAIGWMLARLPIPPDLLERVAALNARRGESRMD